MKNLILNEIIKNGIFISDQILNEFERNNLNKDFKKKNDIISFQIKSEDEIKKISETLFSFLQKDFIKDFLKDYLGSEFECTNILFTRTKPEFKKEDDENIKEGNVMGFHNDNSGKQIKINILLSDLNENSNGLEYAISSHKISKLDNYLVSLLRFFGLFKNWDKHFLNYQKNKIMGQKVNFINEKNIKRKFKIKKVYGKSGLVYIFDTNGFHRQGTLDSGTSSFNKRELITLYLNSKKTKMNNKF